MNNRLLEISLIEIIVLIGLNLINTKVAVFIGLMTGILSFCILAITLTLELIEASKINKSYFYFMGTTSFICLSISITTIYLYGSPFTE